MIKGQPKGPSRAAPGGCDQCSLPEKHGERSPADSCGWAFCPQVTEAGFSAGRWVNGNPWERLKDKTGPQLTVASKT